jgi:acetyl esterase/lipase
MKRLSQRTGNPVVSLRALLTNAMLRITAKRRWRAGVRVESIRARACALDARFNRWPAGVPEQQIVVNDVPCTWYGAPGQAQNGTLLYLHGGGWCMHLPRLYAGFAARLGALTGLRVLLPDYRLAPEHPFPAGVDDCFAVYRDIAAGPAAGPLFIAGDSAGGSLTAVTLMRARDAGCPMPAAAVLLSPSTDLTMSGASYRYNERLDPIFSLQATKLLPDVYCPDADLHDPWLSPLFGDWRGLPPLLFIAGSTEMLLDDSIRAHDRARAAGVEAQLHVYEGMPHVFPVFEWLPEGRAALDEIAEFIRARRGASNATTITAGALPAPVFPDSYARSGA